MGDACILGVTLPAPRCSVFLLYLLYWYKSTNADSACSQLGLDFCDVGRLGGGGGRSRSLGGGYAGGRGGGGGQRGRAGGGVETCVARPQLVKGLVEQVLSLLALLVQNLQNYKG